MIETAHSYHKLLWNINKRMVIISSYSDHWTSAVFVQSQKFMTPSFMKFPELWAMH